MLIIDTYGTEIASFKRMIAYLQSAQLASNIGPML